MAAIEEFDALQEQFRIKSQIWNNHARLGLQAICALQRQPQEKKAHYFQKPPDIPEKKSAAGDGSIKKPILSRSNRTKTPSFDRPSSHPLGKIDENIAFTNRFAALELLRK